MTNFSELQRAFQERVLTGGKEFDVHVVGDARASASERLAVYFDAYRLRLVGILEADFPGVRGLSTAETFRELGLAYLDAYPSDDPSVRWFGRHFATFLASPGAPFAAPVVEEMARFEWGRSLAFDAANEPRLVAQELAALNPADWPSLRLSLHPSTRRVLFNWNTDELWRAIKSANEVPRPIERPKAQTCVIWRDELTVYWRVMDEFEARALGAFADGRDFSAVCEQLAERADPSEVPGQAAQLLSSWVNDGLIGEIMR